MTEENIFNRLSNPGWFMVGDLVSRDGTDLQEVIETNEEDAPDYPPDLITVRCIRAPMDGWCTVGEEESNLARRYNLVARAGAAKTEVKSL
jgi:hypothetical protein